MFLRDRVHENIRNKYLYENCMDASFNCLRRRGNLFRRQWVDGDEEAVGKLPEEKALLTCVAERGVFIQSDQRRVQQDSVIVFRYDAMVRGLDPGFVLINWKGEQGMDRLQQDHTAHGQQIIRAFWISHAYQMP